MLSALMLSILVPVTGVAESPVRVIPGQDPPVKLWLSKQNARLGDRVRVDVRTEGDGYLLVLHAEPDGRVRVLFPLDPIYDNFVRGGDEFEVRGRADREAFRVYASSGVGTVYAAFSRDPFQFEEYLRGDHWDYMLSDLWYAGDDAEASLTDIVLRMASGAYFDYDVVQYGVGETVAYGGAQTHLALYADPYWADSWLSFGIHFGSWYSPWRWRSAWWRWRYLGWAYYDPWYDPWYYDPFYSGYGWGYGYYNPYGWGYSPYYYAGYYRAYPRYRYRSRPVVVYADDHLRLQPRLTPRNSADRGRRVYASTLGSSVRRMSSPSRVAAASRQVTTTSARNSRGQVVRTISSARRVTDAARVSPVRQTTETARRTTASTARTTQRLEPTRQATPTRNATAARRVTLTPARQAAPSRSTTTARPVTPTRQATPSRSTTTTRRVTPTRQATPSRSTTTIRPATPTRQATPSRSTTSARRVTPTRPSTSVRRATPSRVTSRPVTTTRPATTRSAPVRSVPSRPVTTRSAPRVTRPSTPTVRRPASSSSSRSVSRSSSSSSRRRRP